MATNIAQQTDFEPGSWLLAVGVIAIILGFFVASQVLVVYSMKLFLYTGLYIAFQVGGWLAVLTWYVTR